MWYLKQGKIFSTWSVHEAHKQLHVESTSTLRDDFGSSKPSSKKGNNLDLEGFLSNPQNPTFGIKFFGLFPKLWD